LSIFPERKQLKAKRSPQLHQRSLDIYQIKEQSMERRDVFPIPIKVTIINVNLSGRPSERMLIRKVGILVSVLLDLQNHEGYALQTRVRDTLSMMGVVRDDNEFERLLRFAHLTHRIREHGGINGAWVACT
jgi:hypothetical protein